MEYREMVMGLHNIGLRVVQDVVFNHTFASGQNPFSVLVMQPLLANAALMPKPTNISLAASAFQTFLRIRQSSRLFHMGSLEEVQKNLHFLNTGTSQIPGVIVMKLDDGNEGDGRRYGREEGNGFDHIVVVFNATASTINFQSDQLKSLGLRLHPLQSDSSDADTAASVFDDKAGTATVKPLTTAVFVSRCESGYTLGRYCDNR